MRRPRPLAAALLCAAAASLSAEEAGQGPQPVGLDLGKPLRALGRAIAGGEKPWSADLAALTDPDPGVQMQAVRALIGHGAAVAADLAALAEDRDPLLRQRICMVIAGIGGADVAELGLRLSRDGDRRVRSLAVLALGRAAGPGVAPRLEECLRDGDPDLRSAAAEALAMQGDPAALAALLRTLPDPDDLARRAKRGAIERLVRRGDAVPTAVELLSTLPAGPGRAALVEAVQPVADRRLCPPLAAVAGDPEAWAALLAVRALAVCGDSRAYEVLVRLATAARPELAAEAAATLRILTGHPAGPGQAWAIWWRDAQPRMARLIERDAAIAAWHAATPAAAEIGRFAPEELGVLIDAILPGHPAPWWSARALAALAADDHRRWLAPLRARLAATADPGDRAALVVLLDHLAGADAGPLFAELTAQLDAKAAGERKAAAAQGALPPDRGAERLALGMARQRRGLR